MVDLDKIKQSELWYVVGYIASDGYLSSDSRHINITSKDREHLYKIRNALGINNKIGWKKRGKEKIKRYSQLQFGDVNFYRYLLRIGFSSKKSLILDKIDINNNFFIDFIRGVIDGDGNISTWIHHTNHNRQWCLRIFSASVLFIEWMKNRIEKDFNASGKLYSRKVINRKNIVYTLKFGKIEALKILRKVYYEGCLSLERKYLKAHLCLQDDRKMVNYA